MKDKINAKGWIMVLSIVLVSGFVAYFLFFYNGGFAKAVFDNSIITSNWTDVDNVSALISAYSIFITVVLFAIGIPIALLSLNTRKESKDDFNEIKSDFKETKKELEKEYSNIKSDYQIMKNESARQHSEIKEQIEPIDDEIKENAAFKIVEKLYIKDPHNIWEGQSLREFSEFFSKKHSQEAKKYFYQAIYLMKDKIININEIEDDFSKYKKDIQVISTAVGYFRMCEDLILFDLDKDNFRSDMYREMSNAYKSLGVCFYKFNNGLALDNLLNALEYCQKSICEIDYYMLPYNNKSNILKDIFRLCRKAPKNERAILVRKLEDRIKSFSLNVFDFKQIIQYIEDIYAERNFKLDEKQKEAIKELEQLKSICSETKTCARCKCNCTEYFDRAEKFGDLGKLLLLLAVESIICIKERVLERLYFFTKEEEDRDRFIQRCYYNCAISNYMLIEYSLIELQAVPATKEYSMYKYFKENIIHSMEYFDQKIRYDKQAFENEINCDVDLKSLLNPNDDESMNNEHLERLRREMKSIIQEHLKD